LTGSLMSVFLKYVLEFIQLTGFAVAIQHFTTIYFILMAAAAIATNLTVLNIGLKFYNQLEMIPITKSSLMINNMLCAGIIVNEFVYYDWWQIVLLFTGAFICVAGILIIMKKDSLLSATRVEIYDYSRRDVGFGMNLVLDKVQKEGKIIGQTLTSRKSGEDEEYKKI